MTVKELIKLLETVDDPAGTPVFIAMNDGTYYKEIGIAYSEGWVELQPKRKA